MSVFPKFDKSSVIPRDIPQVPNADVISKMMAVMDKDGSEIDNAIVANNTMKIDKIMTAYERNTSVN